MSIEMDFSGLEKLQKNLEKIEGEQRVPLPELMPDSFIREHTNFQTLEAMLKAGGVESLEDGERIDSAEFSDFIGSRTRFPSWNALCEAAVGEWAARQLEL